MTSLPEPPRDGAESRRTERRFVWASATVVLLLLIVLALGLNYSLTSRNKVCPPDNPDCGLMPPTAPPAQLPGAPPPTTDPPR
ncbi:MAG TPA: hypothetical protein VGI89_09485 [Rhizomicrobium sp.]